MDTFDHKCNNPLKEEEKAAIMKELKIVENSYYKMAYACRECILKPLEEVENINLPVLVLSHIFKTICVSKEAAIDLTKDILEVIEKDLGLPFEQIKKRLEGTEELAAGNKTAAQ